MLAVITGPVRSGKSGLGLQLALDSGHPVVMAVGARADDDEMTRRIARHRAERPSGMVVVETAGDPDWIDQVPAGACLLLDCLGTVLGGQLVGLVPAGAETATEPAEERARELADTLVDRLLTREDVTVVVTNEVGWGIVPATPLGRIFRDVMGRANRRLADGADAVWLVVAGRCIDIHSHTQEATWPNT